MSLSRNAYPESSWADDDPRIVTVDDYLAPRAAAEMLSLATRTAYEAAGTLPPDSNEPLVDAGYRRGWISFPTEEPILALAIGVCELIASRFDTARGIEAEDEPEVHLVASRPGDYFRPHTDNGHPLLAARRYTWVYYLHRTPRRFRGGQLLVYPQGADRSPRARPSRIIEPKHNRLVFFPASRLHEARPVIARNLEFADSRFSFVGWLSERRTAQGRR